MATDKQLKYLKQMLVMDMMRGEHATGIFKVNRMSNSVAIHKKALDAIDYLASEDTKEFLDKDRGHIYVGHNRYATVGSRCDKGAHPFQYEHITLVHNGSVDFWAMDTLEGFEKPHVTVDSEMVCHTIAEHGIKKAVEEYLSGAFSLVWWDSKERSLNFIRNDERPMFMAWLNDGTMVWASEEAFIETFVDRDKTLNYVKNGEPISTEVGRHYKWLFNDKGLLENKGTPFLEDFKFHEAPRSYGYNNKNWDDWYAPQRTQSSTVAPVQRTPGGSYLGTQTTIDLRNETLAKSGLKVLMGDRITFDATTWDENPHASNRGKGVLRGTFEGFPATSYQVPEEVVYTNGKMNTKFTGVITSAYEVQGQLKLSLDEVEVYKARQLRVVVTHNFTKKCFPLKVEGYTFRDEDDFKDLVSGGCACCGLIPTPSNVLNSHINVYLDPDDSSFRPNHEFICGSCIVEDIKGGNKA